MANVTLVFLSQAKLSRRLDLSTPTIARAIKAGRIRPDGRMGNQLLFLENRIPEIQSMIGGVQ